MPRRPAPDGDFGELNGQSEHKFCATLRSRLRRPRRAIESQNQNMDEVKQLFYSVRDIVAFGSRIVTIDKSSAWLVTSRGDTYRPFF